jgi:hypothetical protein
MVNQFLYLLRSGGALDVDGEDHALECRARPFQAHFIRYVEGTPNIDLACFDRNFVKVREPRNLGEQSERRADEKVGQRRRALIGAAALLGLVGFETNPPVLFLPSGHFQ